MSVAILRYMKIAERDIGVETKTLREGVARKRTCGGLELCASVNVRGLLRHAIHALFTFQEDLEFVPR